MSGMLHRLTKRRTSTHPPSRASSSSAAEHPPSDNTAAVLPQTLVEEPEEIREGKGHAEQPDSASPLRRAIAGLRLIIQRGVRNQDDAETIVRRLELVLSSWTSDANDAPGRQRREFLARDLESVNDTLADIIRQDRGQGSTHISVLVQLYLSKVQRALVDYELSLLRDLYARNVERQLYDEINTLDRISRAKDATHESNDYRPGCIEDTRDEIMQALQAWANDPTGKQVYWLDGHAGSGKSTIAQSFAQSLYSQEKLGASYFCSQASELKSDPKTIIPAIAYQLTRSKHPAAPNYRKEILRAISSNPDVAWSALRYQIQELLVRPIKETGLEGIVIIDALDEYKDDSTLALFLTVLDGAISQIPTIRFFITSRPEVHIRMGFRMSHVEPITQTMLLCDAGAASVDRDIGVYLSKTLVHTVRRRSNLDLPDEWPTKDEINSLVKKCGGQFIVARFIVKVIDTVYYDPRNQLKKLLRDLNSSKYEGSAGLDAFYQKTLNGIYPRSDDSYFRKLRAIFGLLAVTQEHILHFDTIAEALGMDELTVRITIRTLHSLMNLPHDENDSRPVRFHHWSFPDFLADPTRCTDKRFAINRDDHLEAAQRCVKILEGKSKAPA